MSSAAIFVPKAFRITLKRPKKQNDAQSPIKVCRVSNCKQLYDPNSRANKKFYATLSYAQQDRRNYCPMHAAMAIDDGGAIPKTKENSISTAKMKEMPTKRTLGFGASLKTGQFAKQKSIMPPSRRSSISSSQNSILSANTARKSSDDLLSQQPEVVELPEWGEKLGKTTFGFQDVGDDTEGGGNGMGR